VKMIENNKINREKLRRIMDEELEMMKINQRLANDFFIESLIQGENSNYLDRIQAVLYENNLN